MGKSSNVKVVSYSCKAYDKQALCRVFDETISASYVEGVLDKGTVFYAQDALVVVRDGNFSLNGLLGFDMHRQPPKIFMNFVKATAQQV